MLSTDHQLGIGRQNSSSNHLGLPFDYITIYLKKYKREVHWMGGNHIFTPPCAMASSAMGSIWGLRFLPTTHAKSNAFMIFMCHVVFYACFIVTLRLQLMQWHTSGGYVTAVDAVTNAPDEPWLFWFWEKPEAPKLSSMPGQRWCRF